MARRKKEENKSPEKGNKGKRERDSRVRWLVYTYMRRARIYIISNMWFTLCTCQSTPAVRMLMTPKWRSRNAMRVCGTVTACPDPEYAVGHRRSAIMTHVTWFYYFNGPRRSPRDSHTHRLFRTEIVLSFKLNPSRAIRHRFDLLVFYRERTKN